MDPSTDQAFDPPWREPGEAADEAGAREWAFTQRPVTLPRSRWAGRWDAAPVGWATSLWLDQMGARELLDRWAATSALDVRSACAPWLRGLKTKKGSSRWPRVRRCGRLALGVCPELELEGVAPLWCQDRACPVCTVRTAKKRAAAAGHHAAAFGLLQDAHFVTLTQGRGPEGPGAATNRLYDSARAMAQSRRGRLLLRNVSLVRTTELVYRPWRADGKGRNVGDWHPHFHLIVSNRSRDWVEDFIELWLTYSPGANRVGQNTSKAQESTCRELLKYATKGLELSPACSRQAFEALAGRRLHQAKGLWSHWVDAGPKLPAIVLSRALDDAEPEDASRGIANWIREGLTLTAAVAARVGADECADASQSDD